MNAIKENHLILFVEDSDEDYQTTLRAFKKAGLHNPVQRCEDGDEALDYLFRRGKFSDPANSPRPELVLLDLNLPGTDGRDVLIEIKNDQELRRIPIIVLTTSSDERDIDKCYQDGANSYIHKPVNLENFFQAIQKLKDFWFEVAILPKEINGA
ncbi:MAG: response regulator [Nitrospinae bacterium]|nr:response regulator [Nitrospinota bacterium]